jgi:hypothetical protein
MAKGRIGEFYGGIEMREEMILEEAKLLMKLVEEVLRVVGVDEDPPSKIDVEFPWR